VFSKAAVTNVQPGPTFNQERSPNRGPHIRERRSLRLWKCIRFSPVLQFLARRKQKPPPPTAFLQIHRGKGRDPPGSGQTRTSGPPLKPEYPRDSRGIAPQNQKEGLPETNRITQFPPPEKRTEKKKKENGIQASASPS